jgi:hypothetical protein
LVVVPNTVVYRVSPELFDLIDENNPAVGLGDINR